MRLIKFILPLLFLVSIAIWQCGGPPGGASTKAITIPSNENNYLVVGSIIIENNWYSSGEGGMTTDGRQVQETYSKGIEVAILAKVIGENGKEEYKGYYVNTDENGYFFIENVLPGEYGLKGFRISMNDGRYLVVYSDLDGSDSPYMMRRKEEQMIVFKGDYFPFPANNRVVNLRHNVFFMSNTLMLGHQTFVTMKDQAFNFSSIKYTREPVEQYYMNKFPDTGWKMFLQGSMQKNLESGL